MFTSSSFIHTTTSCPWLSPLFCALCSSYAQLHIHLLSTVRCPMFKSHNFKSITQTLCVAHALYIWNAVLKLLLCSCQSCLKLSSILQSMPRPPIAFQIYPCQVCLLFSVADVMTSCCSAIHTTSCQAVYILSSANVILHCHLYAIHQELSKTCKGEELCVGEMAISKMSWHQQQDGVVLTDE